VLGGKDRPDLFTAMNEQWRSNLALGGNPDSTVIEFLNAEYKLGHHQQQGRVARTIRLHPRSSL